MKYLGLLIVALVISSCSDRPPVYSHSWEGRTCEDNNDCMLHYHCSSSSVQRSKTCVWDGGYFRR